MGLAALIWGAIVGASATKAAIDNAKMKSEPYRYLDDGTPVYLDRKCDEYINGEKVITKWYKDSNGDIKTVRAGQRSNTVYFDPNAAMQKKYYDANQQRKEEAKAQGYLAYSKYDTTRKKYITCEIATERYIASLRHINGVYKKYYLPPERILSSMPAENDPGIEITAEEFRKLDIIGGSHLKCGR